MVNPMAGLLYMVDSSTVVVRMMNPMAGLLYMVDSSSWDDDDSYGRSPVYGGQQ